MRIAAIALGSAAVFYLLLCALVFLGQRSLLFPAPPGAREPRLPGAQLVRLDKALALHLPASPGKRTVVLFHGNAEDLADAPWLASAFADAGLGVLAVEFPGYGLLRARAPSEAALIESAETALRWLEQSTPREQIVLLGVSLGSGVAVQLAARGHGSRLILVTPYTSIADAASHHFPWLPAKLLVRDRFDNERVAPSITIPTLIIHGTDDEVIPFALGERLSKRFPSAEFIRAERSHHNDLLDAVRLQQLVAFAKQ